MPDTEDILGNKKEKFKSESKTIVANLVKLDPVNPIPIDIGSDIFQIVPAGGAYYHPFLDEKDNFPNLLWETRLLSATKNSCVTSIAKTCVGEGIQVTNVEPDRVDKEFLGFIRDINPCQTLNELLKTGIECEETDGNAWIEIVKGDLSGKKYIKAYVHTTLICRLKYEKGAESDEATSVLKSKLFAKSRNGVVSGRTLKSAEIPLYSGNPLDETKAWVKTKGGDLATMIHVKNNFPGMLHYGLPRSVGGLRYEVLEGKSAQYNIDEFDNNMVMSGLIVFKGSMTQTEANKAAKEIIKTHTGQGKHGRVGVISSENGIEDFTWVPLETKREGSYLELDKRIVERIITASNWDPVFFGIVDSGTLGKGSTFIKAIFEIKKATVMDPIVNHWVDSFLKPLIKIAADHLGKKEWLNYELNCKTLMPLSYATDIDVNKILTKNEGRELIGEEEKTGPEWEQPIDSGKASISVDTGKNPKIPEPKNHV